MQANPTSHHRLAIEQQGFTNLPGFFSAAECTEMARLLDMVHRNAGAPSFAGWGFTMHPLFDREPALARFLGHSTLLSILSETLGGPVRCVHSGARLSDGTSASNIGYHQHYAWPAAGLPQRNRIERLLFLVYIDGTGPEQGPLVVLPRAMRDPLLPLAGDVTGAEYLPGQVDLSFPPGTVSIFDTALWHTARKGTSDARRRLFGTHVQRCDDTRSHPEDNGTPFSW